MKKLRTEDEIIADINSTQKEINKKQRPAIYTRPLQDKIRHLQKELEEVRKQ